jgi:hypothetical protein
MMDTAAKLRYAELRKQGAELPDIARAMNLPEEPLRELSRAAELEGLEIRRFFWGCELKEPMIEGELSLDDTDLERLRKELDSFVEEATSKKGCCPWCGQERAA